jgi:DNA-binding protein H-NS
VDKEKRHQQRTILLSIRDHQSRIESITEELIRAGINRESLLKLAREFEIEESEIQHALSNP